MKTTLWLFVCLFLFGSLAMGAEKNDLTEVTMCGGVYYQIPSYQNTYEPQALGHSLMAVSLDYRLAASLVDSKCQPIGPDRAATYNEEFLYLKKVEGYDNDAKLDSDYLAFIATEYAEDLAYGRIPNPLDNGIEIKEIKLETGNRHSKYFPYLVKVDPYICRNGVPLISLDGIQESACDNANLSKGVAFSGGKSQTDSVVFAALLHFNPFTEEEEFVPKNYGSSYLNALESFKQKGAGVNRNVDGNVVAAWSQDPQDCIEGRITDDSRFRSCQKLQDAAGGFTKVKKMGVNVPAFVFLGALLLVALTLIHSSRKSRVGIIT